MIEKYGKSINMRSTGRDIEEIKKEITISCADANKYYKSSDRIPECRICGGGNSHLYVDVLGKYQYYECDNCNSIFLNNYPDVEKMYAGKDTANGEIYINESVYESRVNNISAPKVNFILDVCREYRIKVDQWLDIGCGGAEILFYLKNNSDINPIGIESDQAEYEFAIAKGMDIYNSFIDIEKRDKEIEKRISTSSVISFFNVLEHVSNPVGFVEYIINYMQKGTVLVFEAPRHPAMASFVNQTAPNVVYRHIVPPIHLNLFNEKSLKYLFKDKMEILAKWEFGQGYTDMLNALMVISDNHDYGIYDKLMNLSNEIQPIIDKAGFADQILVVAQKL